MKNTRKRSCTEAHQDGVDAAWAGKDKDACSFDDEEERSLWMDGFKAAVATIRRCFTRKNDD